jgi:hypothetical protein
MRAAINQWEPMVDLICCTVASFGEQPPLVLRQVKLTRKGRTILLVTSLRDERTLTNGELAELYRQRWGVEVFHRSLKQTFGRGNPVRPAALAVSTSTYSSTIAIPFAAA